MNILILISLILFTLITIYKTRLGVYLILILIPSFLIRAEVLGIPTTFLELSIYLLAIIWAVKKLKIENWNIKNYLKIKNWKLKIIKPFLLPIFLFITAVIISTIISPDKRLSLGILKAWIFDPLLFTIIFINQIKTDKHINKVIASLSLMILWVSSYGIYEYLFNPRNLIEYLRLDSIFTSANYVTMLIVPITILIIGYLISFVKKQLSIINYLSRAESRDQLSNFDKIFIPLLILTTSISITTVYLTKSFSGWLGLGAGIFVLLLLAPIKRKIKIISVCVLLILSGLFIYAQKNNPKFQAIKNFQGRTAIHSRIQIWKTSIEIIKDNPILGIGLGNFHQKYIEYLPQKIDNPLEYAVIKPHNLYLNLWLETGLLGLISFIWLIIIFYKQNSKASSLQLIAYGSMAGLLTQGFFDTPYFKNDLSIIFWIIIGLIIISRRDGRVVEGATLEKS